jgi:hypothetical protein
MQEFLLVLKMDYRQVKNESFNHAFTHANTLKTYNMNTIFEIKTWKKNKFNYTLTTNTCYCIAPSGH